MKMKPVYIRAHAFSSDNRRQIEASEWCGCFYCLEIFRPQELKKWVSGQEGSHATPLCPHCEIDSVIGSASGFPITPDFLRKMKEHWFDADPGLAQDA